MMHDSSSLVSLLPVNIFRDVNGCVALSTLSSCLETREVSQNWLPDTLKFLSSVKRNYETNVTLVHDWCLLPALFREMEVLLPIARSRCVIPLTDRSLLASSLAKLGIPQPLFKYNCSTFYQDVLGSLKSTANVIVAIQLSEWYEAKTMTHLEHSPKQLSEDKCSELLSYFAENLGEWVSLPKSIESVRKLSIFTTVFQKRIALLNSLAYIISHRLCTRDMDSWQSTEGIVFLKASNECINKLFVHLGCKQLSETKTYCDFIFQHFYLLFEEGRLVHLKFVKDTLLEDLDRRSNVEIIPMKKCQHWTVRKERQDAIEERDASRLELNTLLKSLQTLTFLPRSIDSVVSLRSASEYYDWTVEAFRVMLEEESFPPQPFNTYEWLPFLKRCGLVHQLTNEMFLQFARRVEILGQAHVSEDVSKKSKALVEHLFRTQLGLRDATFLQKVSRINFVVPASIGSFKERLCKQYGIHSASGCLELVSFRGSIIKTWENCVWTVQSLLPEWANPKTYSRTLSSWNISECFETLEIDENPQLLKVAQHVGELCGSLAPTLKSSSVDIATLRNVLESVYEILLQNLANGLADGVSVLLTDCPFVFNQRSADDCLLVRPNQIVLRLPSKEAIRPYLISLPLDLGKYSSLFLTLGATESPTLDQYTNVLRDLYTKCGSNDLPAEELTQVKVAVKKLFTLVNESVLNDSTSPIQLSNDDLYLPTSDFKLHKSSLLVFDNSNMSDRLAQFDRPFLVHLKKCGMKDMTVRKIETLIRKLPAISQPTLLSAVVQETVKNDYKIISDCQLTRKIRTRIESDEFQHGLRRLALHANPDIDEAILEESLKNLENVKVVGIDKLLTVLSYKGQVIRGSEKSMLSFYSFKDTETNSRLEGTVFICDHDNGPKVLLYDNVAAVICKVVGGTLGTEYRHVKQILQCKPYQIDRLLDELKIECVMNGSKSRKSSIPKLGSFVPVSFHHCLQQDVQLLNLDQFAALEVEDTAGLVHDNSVEPDFPDYIYVQVIERMIDQENSHEATELNKTVLAKYKVKISRSEEKISPATLLYAFDCASTCDASLTNSKEDEANEDNFDYVSVARDLRILQVAWTLADNDKRNILKRLFLRWHPMKNPKISEIASTISLLLLWACDRLEEGRPIDEKDVFEVNSTSYTLTWTPTMSASAGSSGGIPLVGACCAYAQHRAEEHRRQQQQFEQNEATSETDEPRVTPLNFHQSARFMCNPQPGEGRRWLLQARMDFHAASNDEGAIDCYEWSCFQYYQAAVKALLAVHLTRDVNTYYDVNGSIHRMSRDLHDDELSSLVESLTDVVGDPNRMQYPRAPYPIPRYLFTPETVGRARDSVRAIIDWCKVTLRQWSHE